MDIKILENLLLETIDRGNLTSRHHQEKISWDTLQKVAFHREEPLLSRKCAFRKVRRDDSRWIGET